VESVEYVGHQVGIDPQLRVDGAGNGIFRHRDVERIVVAASSFATLVEISWPSG
jgi:hypothetical protein